VAAMSVEGSTDGAVFLAFLREIVLPSTWRAIGSIDLRSSLLNCPTTFGPTGW
jgi:hypothetical protein